MTNSNGRAVDRRKLLVASESFSLVRGGIARVGRLLARLAADIGLEADLLALSDPEPTTDFGLPARTAAGGRAGFAFRCWTGGVTRSHFMYNHVGMARAHCSMPMLDRPYALWIYGIEAWSSRMHGDYGRSVEEASLLLSITDFTRRRAAELLPSAQRAKVCWLATEEDDVPKEPNDFGGPPTVLILSRVDASEMYKGHFELIDCWPSVMAAIPDARLLIAGGGDGLGHIARPGAARPRRRAISSSRVFCPKTRSTRSGPGPMFSRCPAVGKGLAWCISKRCGVVCR